MDANGTSQTEAALSLDGLNAMSRREVAEVASLCHIDPDGLSKDAMIRLLLTPEDEQTIGHASPEDEADDTEDECEYCNNTGLGCLHH